MTSVFRLPVFAGAAVFAVLVVLLLTWLPTGYARAGEPALAATTAPTTPRVPETAPPTRSGGGGPAPASGATSPDPPVRDGHGGAPDEDEQHGGLFPWFPVRIPGVIGSRPGDEALPGDDAQSGNEAHTGRPARPSAVSPTPSTPASAAPSPRTSRTAPPGTPAAEERHSRTGGGNPSAVSSSGAALSVPLPPPAPPPASAEERTPDTATSDPGTPVPGARDAHRAVASRGGAASGQMALGGGLICVGLGLATAFLGLRLRRA
ncbi:hypothetical protein AB0J21_09670 [Streptomyces sp. NPDC049954]|uniref:hypothetical protein n=1 Tax=Streptomyces sp. NPDC049954 TaxID=3155779 RepID=UPI00344060D2